MSIILGKQNSIYVSSTNHIMYIYAIYRQVGRLYKYKTWLKRFSGTFSCVPIIQLFFGLLDRAGRRRPSFVLPDIIIVDVLPSSLLLYYYFSSPCCNTSPAPAISINQTCSIMYVFSFSKNSCKFSKQIANKC